MMTRRQLLKSGLLGLAGLSLTQPTQAQQASHRYGIVGRTAAELDIDYWIDKDGKPTSFKLADHENKWVFLKCFQSWCPGCHSHGLPALKKISEALADNPKVVFAGIQTVFEGYGVNTIDKVRETQLQYNLQMPMGHNPGKAEQMPPSVMMNYRTGGTPWMILINPDRKVVYNDFSINADNAIKFLIEETS